MLLVGLAIALIAVGPPTVWRPQSPTGAGRPLHASQRVAQGSLASLAADLRHSTGHESAWQINAENDGLSRRQIASDRAVTGSLAGLAADVAHSRGAELVLRINAANDGLGPKDCAAWGFISDGRGLPTWTGFAVLGRVLLANRAPAEDGRPGTAFDGIHPPRIAGLAISGWSGCTAYQVGCDERGHSELARASKDRRDRLRWPMRVAASLAQYSRKLPPALQRVAAWATDGAGHWTASLPRGPLAARTAEFGPPRRWATAGSARTRGL